MAAVGSLLWTYIYGSICSQDRVPGKEKGKGQSKKNPCVYIPYTLRRALLGGAPEAECYLSHKVDKSLHFVGDFTAVLYGTLIEW